MTEPSCIRPTGGDWIAISEEPLPVDAAWTWASVPDCGGIVTFCGTVRDHSDGRAGVTSLEYEAYEEHVVPRLADVADRRPGPWPEIGRLVLLHRVGRLEVGEVAVVVVASTPHRAEAFAAAQFCIDTLKHTVPIWKRETWDGRLRLGLCAHEEPRMTSPLRRHRLASSRSRPWHDPPRRGTALRARLRAHRCLPSSSPLDDALGCVVSSPVVATEQVPSFANSSMDGYAVRAEDTSGAPVTLAVIGSVMAGHPLDRTVGPGQAARIMTGAPLPSGADAVCMIEETEPGTGRTQRRDRPRAATGIFVRPPGRDVAIGDVIAPAGTVLCPRPPGCPRQSGYRHGAGPSPSHASACSPPATSCSPERARSPPARSATPTATPSWPWCAAKDGTASTSGSWETTNPLWWSVARPRRRPVMPIMTSGGVSVGDLDLVRVVLEKLSAGKMRWMQVAIRPAKPFAFGVLADSATPVFGLPGNPVSAMVSFELFVRPALRRLGGHHVLHRPDRLVDRPMSTCPAARRQAPSLRARVTPRRHDVVAGPHDRRPGVPPAPFHVRGQRADPPSRRRRRRGRGAGRRAADRPRSAECRCLTRSVPHARSRWRSRDGPGARGTLGAAASSQARKLPVRSQTMPLEGPLVDRYGRVHDDLRISVTDRCNLRCVYCMPEEGLSFLPSSELLTFDEITRVARVAKSSRRHRSCASPAESRWCARACPPSSPGSSAVGFEDLAMTTNGTELAQVATEPGLGRAAPGQRELRLTATRPVRRRYAGAGTSTSSSTPWTRPRRPA